jgi:hypothetical protein
LGKFDGSPRTAALKKKTGATLNSKGNLGSSKTGDSGPKVQNKTKTLEDIDEFSRNPALERVHREEESGSIGSPKANINTYASSRISNSPKNSKTFVRQKTIQEERSGERLKSQKIMDANLTKLKKNS